MDFNLPADLTAYLDELDGFIARENGAIDWLSDGRLIVGVGAGWLQAEFAALGVPFDERGRRTDEAIRELRDLWAGRG